MTIFDAPHRVHVDGGACCTPGAAPRTGLARLVDSPLRVVLLAVVGVLAVDAAGTDTGPGLCVFRRCTGGYCPGCGMTRSARHLSRGEFAAAWHDHPWLVLAAAQAVVAVAVWGVLRRVGRRLDTQRVVMVVGIVNVVLSLGIWIARLVDGSIPRFF